MNESYLARWDRSVSFYFDDDGSNHSWVGVTNPSTIVHRWKGALFRRRRHDSVPFDLWMILLLLLSHSYCFLYKCRYLDECRLETFTIHISNHHHNVKSEHHESVDPRSYVITGTTIATGTTNQPEDQRPSCSSPTQTTMNNNGRSLLEHTSFVTEKFTAYLHTGPIDLR